MRHRFVAIAAACVGSLCLGSASQAAGACKTSKIYTYCTDNSLELAGQCSVYENGSAFYNMCIGNSTLDAVYTCQDYRVPCNFGGTFFDRLDLDRYPKVGAPTPPRPGTAPLDLKGSFLGTLLHLY